MSTLNRPPRPGSRSSIAVGPTPTIPDGGPTTVAAIEHCLSAIDVASAAREVINMDDASTVDATADFER